MTKNFITFVVNDHNFMIVFSSSIKKHDHNVSGTKVPVSLSQIFLSQYDKNTHKPLILVTQTHPYESIGAMLL